jgi:triosephosphate isomerase
MKNKIIAANWKSNITKDEAKFWLNEVSALLENINFNVVLFPPFTLLDVISGYIRANDLKLSLGAQDISPFSNGPHTGEISGKLIKEFADYVLIGHSERRAELGENNELINLKISEATKNELKPIVCVSEIDQVNFLNFDRIMLAYEPISAIGTNNPMNPQEVSQKIKEFKEVANVDILYGGSVSDGNISKYLEEDLVSGVLVGNNSLIPQDFINLIKNA